MSVILDALRRGRKPAARPPAAAEHGRVPRGLGLEPRDRLPQPARRPRPAALVALAVAVLAILWALLHLMLR